MADLETDLLCFGNPLLDMVLRVDDDRLLTKYNLIPDNQAEASPSQKPLFDDVFTDARVTLCPGGGAQNTARIYHWVLAERGRVVFIGTVGADKFGSQLEELVRHDGVDTRYIRHEEEPTGRSVSLARGSNRSLVADLGAANFCRPDSVFVPQNVALLTSATYVYVEGFFVTHDPETALQVAQFCRTSDRSLVFSLSGSYVCEQHTAAVCQMVHCAAYLFGHLTEYSALARAVGLQEGEFELSPRGFCRLTEAVDSRLRTVEAMTRAGCGPTQNAQPTNDTNPELRMVVTQSEKPVVMLDTMQVASVPVPPISPSLVVDTTGAGDAVVGGFLAGRHLQRPLEECLRFGVMAAREVIQLLGCAVPDVPHPLMKAATGDTPN